MAYSKANLKSIGDKASPCLRQLWIGNLWDRYLFVYVSLSMSLYLYLRLSFCGWISLSLSVPIYLVPHNCLYIQVQCSSKCPCALSIRQIFPLIICSFCFLLSFFLLWTRLTFRQVYISHIHHVPENSSCCTTHTSSVSTGFRHQFMPLLRILCYNGILITWTVVSLTNAKFKPLIFSMSGFALSYAANMFTVMISYDLCLLPAQFCCTIVYIREAESCVCKSQIGVHLGKFPVVRRTLFCICCNFKRRCLLLIPRRGSISHYWSDQCRMEV
jgi:hypothetical protein